MQFNPLMIFTALIMGSISAYLAYRREKNPYLWFALGVLFGIFGIFAMFFGADKKKSMEEPKPEPVLKIIGPSDKFWYYLDPTHQQKGPMSRDALTGAWKEGKIDLATYVWHEEMTDWKPLKETIIIE